MCPRGLLLTFAGASLVTGLFAGLTLLGIWADTPAASLGADHGALMVFGFVGGAIGLERTVAARTRWAWAGPVASAIGVVTLLAGAPRLVPAAAFTLAFLVLGAVYLRIHRRQATHAVLVQSTGVIGAVFATVWWGGGADFADIVPFAVVFAVATIIGERMELARVSFAGTAAETTITALSLALVAASLMFALHPQVGFAVMGILIVALALVTVRIDVARRLVHAGKLPKYTAICMLAGYAWLLVAGLLWLGFGHTRAGYLHDAAVHSVFLGFVISMIFAHAPFILGGVIRRTIPYHPTLYVPVALLHGGLSLRVVADLRAADVAWMMGGVLNVVAVLLFMATGAGLMVTDKRRRRLAREKRAARV
ncbi:hypothetical protein CETAM_05385 [Corynebacterium comes]|uniref:Uncharacterized protein n=1 Tax=Corynebacterium comes TaxID=2675218 RepID=A0A6B8VX98_9CORY|nr:hypothetical protein CETAM_05385 [Corynebacterium comes]